MTNDEKYTGVREHIRKVVYEHYESMTPVCRTLQDPDMPWTIDRCMSNELNNTLLRLLRWQVQLPVNIIVESLYD